MKTGLEANLLFVFFLIFSLTIYNSSAKHLKKEIIMNKHKFYHSMSLVQQTNSTYSVNLSSDNKNMFSYGVCNIENCKMPYGTCLDGNTCVCSKGYAQDPNNNDSRCTYKLISQGAAFLLEFFLWVGIGHFYSGRIVFGAVKASFIAFTIILDCLVKYPLKSETISTQRCWNIFIYILYFITLAWQVFDVCMFGLNKHKDGNGVPLLAWDYFK